MKKLNQYFGLEEATIADRMFFYGSVGLVGLMTIGLMVTNLFV